MAVLKKGLHAERASVFSEDSLEEQVSIGTEFKDIIQAAIKGERESLQHSESSQGRSELRRKISSASAAPSKARGAPSGIPRIRSERPPPAVAQDLRRLPKQTVSHKPNSTRR